MVPHSHRRTIILEILDLGTEEERWGFSVRGRLEEDGCVARRHRCVESEGAALGKPWGHRLALRVCDDLGRSGHHPTRMGAGGVAAPRGESPFPKKMQAIREALI